MRALRAAFPGLPLRLDPNANGSLEASIRAAPELDELLEYCEDPTPGLKGMAEFARHTRLPLATNMVITTLDDFRKGAETGAVKVLLSDHHDWGGLRVTQTLARMCALGSGHVDAFELAPGHQPDGDDPGGGQHPEPDTPRF